MPLVKEIFSLPAIIHPATATYGETSEVVLDTDTRSSMLAILMRSACFAEFQVKGFVFVDGKTSTADFARLHASRLGQVVQPESGK